VGTSARTLGNTGLAPLQRAADAVRRADRFLRLRVAIVAAWAVASLVTASFACPGRGPANSLGAEVELRDAAESFVGGTQVLVRNASDEPWRDVVLTIDDEWRHHLPALRPGEQIVVATAQFRRGEAALAGDHRPRRFAISADRGRHSVQRP
jgi:hypothetical protein